MADVLVVLENFRREALKGGMKVGDAVLCEETDEVESLERVLARRGWEDSSVVCVVGLKLGEEAVEGGDISCTYGMECADFEDFAWGRIGQSGQDRTKWKSGAYGP